MKKSEIYYMAALIVCDGKLLSPDVKLEIIDQLMQDKRTAEWIEKNTENDCEK